MSAYPGHEKAAPATFGDSTGTAEDLDLGTDRVGLKSTALAVVLAVAVVALPLVTDWLATGLIGPEPF